MDLLYVILGLIVLLVVTSMFLASRYKRCPSNMILVIYGRVGGNATSRTLHGGGAFVWPLIQDYTYLPLAPFSLNPVLENGISKENIRVRIPTNFTIAISEKPEILKHATERLLGLDNRLIHELANDTIIGQLRQIVSTMGIEELNTDREKFVTAINEYVENELNKLGLTVLNVNIIDIKDDSGYLEAIGKRAAEEAKQNAIVQIAEQQRIGETGSATADKQKKSEVAQLNADRDIAVKKSETEREIQLAQRNADQEVATKKAQYEQKAKIATAEAESQRVQNESKALMAQYNSDLQVKQAQALKEGEVARLEAEKLVMDAQKALTQSEIEKDELAQVEVDLKKAKFVADAKAQAIMIEAEAEAKKIDMITTANADGEKKMLTAKAEGYKDMISAMGSQAAVLLTLEQLPQLVAMQVEAIKGIKVDKLTIIEGSEGNAISGHAQDLMKTLPKLHEIASNVGLKLPAFLGDMTVPEANKALAELEPTPTKE